MMKNFSAFAILFLTTLQSCSGDMTGTSAIIYLCLFFVLIIMFVFLIPSYPGFFEVNKKDEKDRTTIGTPVKSLDKTKFIRSGTLLSGHPNVDYSINNSVVEFRDNDLRIYRVSDYSYFYYGEGKPTFVASIPLDSISNIVTEDKTQIEKRISAGRLLLVGVFALAWKKKDVMEMQFVTVTWKPGKFENNTLFVFEGSGSTEHANRFSNAIKRAAS